MSPLQQVETENLFNTVYDIEGVRHPIENQQALDAAADYIHKKMHDSGMQVREQIFSVDGWDTPFRNIEGSIGPVDKRPAAVIVAHYDTVAISPGANDNAAGVATMLEAGRILAQLESPPPIYFVAVSLEESSNPMMDGVERESALKLGIKDKNNRFTSWEITKSMKAIKNIVDTEYYGGKSQGDAYQIALTKMRGDIPATVKMHIEEIIPLYESTTIVSAIGTRSRIGSDRWVRDALKANKSIAFSITLDEPGIFNNEPGTQGKLGGMGFELFNHQYCMDAENQVGNFIALITNKNSSHLGAVYHEYCQHKSIDLPCGWIDVDWSFDEVVKYGPIGLNSDHAPFWKAGIPALLIFDTSDARDPWVHTMADSIDKIDFDRLGEVTQALIATLMDKRSFG